MSRSPESHHERRHPTTKQYVMVATFLFVITAIEVAIIYIAALKDVKVPLLVLFSAIKFATVVMFYMHLKFDSRLFTGLFVGGLALAFAVGVGLLVLFGALHSSPRPRSFAEANATPYTEHEKGNGPKDQGIAPGGTLVPTVPPSGAPSAASGGDSADLVAQGKGIFTGKGGCTGCHTIQGISTGQVGPELTHVATNAATRKPGMSAKDYIAESVRDPEAFVAPGFPPGIMTKAITSSLSDSEVQALVAFLLAQK